MNVDAEKLAERLQELLPAIYRLRDAEQGGSLQALLSVLAEQIMVLEEDLAQLYDDQFIETCAEWVVPYIGDVVGYRQLYGLTSQVRSPRAEVANTIGYRRRKGTAVMLQQLARDVTGWDARVVEFFQRLATTQYLNHLRLDNLSTHSVRGWEPVERLDTPFDRLTHTVDVRRIANGRGRYNIPHVGIFLWRLRSYSLTNSPAFKLDDRRYLFSPLGTNMPLFTRPQTEKGKEMTHLADPINVPMPISRRVLDTYLKDYYGKDSSLFLKDVESPDRIVICNLSDKDAAGTVWAHMPPAGKIAIDPLLGRIAFASAPPQAPLVTFHYGFSANMGGGEYDRADSLDLQLHPVETVPLPHATIQEALTTVRNGGVVEISNSGRYEETPAITVAAAQSIELRGADAARPTLVLKGDLQISGEDGAQVTLNGLLIDGGRLRVVETGDHKALQRLRLRHCTLVPGLTLSSDATPQQPTVPSLIIESAKTIVEIDHCILGGLRVVDGAHIHITNSIIDATAESSVAYAGPDGIAAGGPLRIENSTVIGKVHTISLEVASNTIFLAHRAAADAWVAPVISDRRQDGCVRFSYVPLESRVPRRYYCQPTSDADTARVRPMFTSLRYGEPGYGQLSRRSAVEILQGADDEAEMGAFHDLFQPQRETNLGVRLDEYLRFGLEAGVFYAS